jgi:hypothetical protein
MTMKKLGFLTLFVLFAYILVSCAGTSPNLVEPGGKIGDMTVENHISTRYYPHISTYCDPGPIRMKPGTATTDCEIASGISGIAIVFGWGAKDETILESNLETFKWELHIDDHQISVDAFESSPKNWPTGPAREWVIDLVNLTPGKHTLRLLWKTDVPVDDGIDIYPPGTYEDIVNFTVPEE